MRESIDEALTTIANCIPSDIKEGHDALSIVERALRDAGVDLDAEYEVSDDGERVHRVVSQ